MKKTLNTILIICCLLSSCDVESPNANWVYLLHNSSTSSGLSRFSINTQEFESEILRVDDCRVTGFLKQANKLYTIGSRSDFTNYVQVIDLDSKLILKRENYDDEIFLSYYLPMQIINNQLVVSNNVTFENGYLNLIDLSTFAKIDEVLTNGGLIRDFLEVNGKIFMIVEDSLMIWDNSFNEMDKVYLADFYNKLFLDTDNSIVAVSDRSAIRIDLTTLTISPKINLQGTQIYRNGNLVAFDPIENQLFCLITYAQPAIASYGLLKHNLDTNSAVELVILPRLLYTVVTFVSFDPQTKSILLGGYDFDYTGGAPVQVNKVAVYSTNGDLLREHEVPGTPIIAFR